MQKCVCRVREVGARASKWSDRKILKYFGVTLLSHVEVYTLIDLESSHQEPWMFFSDNLSY